MVITFIILILGLAAVVIGANFLTDGASSIAKKLGVSEFLIGMTIVAIGTSLPELVVSLTAAITGSSDLSVGNIVGSNICNIFLILGLTALVVPIPLTKNNVKIDIPITLIVSVLFMIMGIDSVLIGGKENCFSRIDGLILFLLYIFFLFFMTKMSKEENSSSKHEENIQNTGKAIFQTILGLILLITGARFFVDSAVKTAEAIGVSEAVIGITIVAIGTSLPELAASFVAAVKGRSEMAIGNILGSNTANILLIIGTSSLIKPLKLTDISYSDFFVMISGPLVMLVFPLFFKSMKISRIEGSVFLTIYIAYTISLIIL